jgi:hypothetical protein
MQPRDEQALALWQAHRSTPREVVEALLDDFYGVTEFKRQMSCVHVEFPCVISTSQSSSPSSAHSSLEC